MTNLPRADPVQPTEHPITGTLPSKGIPVLAYTQSLQSICSAYRDARSRNRCSTTRRKGRAAGSIDEMRLGRREIRTSWQVVLILALALSPLKPVEAAENRQINVAQGRPYALEPAPNYTLCTGPGDRTDLTDGVLTRGYFWAQQSTVGWQNRSPVTVTIDLGIVTPLSGVSFRTAAGTAGVVWPRSIHLFSSVDGRAFDPLGDLVSLSESPDASSLLGHRVFTYETRGLQSRGRYVRLVLEADGPFLFSDEIEVFGNPKAETEATAREPLVTDTQAFVLNSIVMRRLKAALRRDLETARERVEAASAEIQQIRVWKAELDRLAAAIESLPSVDLKTFRAVLPTGPMQEAIFALIGSVDAASGSLPLTAWLANPWDFLTPVDALAPAAPPHPPLSLLLGETRPAAVNIRNATPDAMTVRVSISGIPNAEAIAVSEVLWTESRAGLAVASAILPVDHGPSGYRAEIPAGITRQLWLRVSGDSFPPGLTTATITVSSDRSFSAHVSLPILVHNTWFPAEPRLHIGGWDYTNVDSIYGLTPENVGPLIEHLKSRHVDSPWATSTALAFGTFDNFGRMVSEPKTDNFDRWISRWPAARRYMVFLNVKDTIGSIPSRSSAFETAVKAWLEFWVTHAKRLGIPPEKLFILLVDEPQDSDSAARFIAWSRGIRRAGTGIKLWENPTFPDPRAIPKAFLESIDVVCLNRGLGLKHGSAFWRHARTLSSPGRQLELYWARSSLESDPYTYYRLQAWQAFSIGGTGSSFWSFGSNGGTDPFNDLAGTQTSYTPMFLGPSSVTEAKQMEAIAESAHDFEVLSLLRDRLASGRGTRNRAALERASRLLSQGVVGVLDAARADDVEWSTPKDRTLADAVRLDAALLLEELSRNDEIP